MNLATKTIFLSRSPRGESVGISDEPIAFPDRVRGAADICSVLRQIRPVKNRLQGVQDFEISGVGGLERTMLAFEYFLGVMVGDMGKRANCLRKPCTMTVLLQLSKRYESNLRFGNFTVCCAGMLGIQMKRSSS